MKKLVLLLAAFALPAVADTPPPGTVKAKTFTGDGATGITATGTSLNVNVTNSGATSTVNQGTGGASPWLVNINGTVPVSGTFWQTTQPVSGTVTANAGTGTFTVDASGHTVPVSGTFWQTTQPVSAASLPLPSGASTAAKQPALGTAGTASSDVLTVQGIASMTALKTDGSGVTQPVSITSGSAVIGKVSIDQTTPGTTNGVQVNAALPAGTNVIGHVVVDTAPTTAVTQSGTWTVQPGNTANTTAWLVNSQPKTPTALTLHQAAITIGTSAVRLTFNGSAPAATRVLLIAQLLSSSTANCYLGSSGVTSSSTTRGVQMFAGQSFSFNNDAGDYYAICDTASQTFFVTEQE